MGDIFGSAPSTSTIDPGTHTTLDPTQQGIESQLAQLLGQGSSFQNNYNGELTAQQTPAQTSTIAALTNALGGVSANLGATTAGVGTAENTLSGVEGSTPADFSSYYQNAVAAPLEQTFQQTTLPSIQRALGASSGGNTGSDAGLAVQTATTNLDQSLAGAASSAGLTEYNDNQTAKLQAASTAGTLANQPLAALDNILGAQTTTQSTQQLTDTNANTQDQQAVTNTQNYATLLRNLLSTQTTASNDVVAQQATPSALGSLLGGAGSLFSSGAGGTSAISGIGNLLGK